MALRIPIYTALNETLQADSCRPLQSAANAGEIQLEAAVHGHYPGRPLPACALPGVKTIGFWDAKKPQTWGLDWHQNEGIEICLLERGNAEFAVEGQVFQLQPNDLTITRPWQRHRLGDPVIQPGRLHWVIIDLGVRRPHQAWKWPEWVVLTEPDLDELTKLLRENEHPVWPNAFDVGRCFARVASVINKNDREQSSEASWLTLLVNELLLNLLALLRGRNIEKNASLADTQRTVALFLEDLTSCRRHLSRDWTLKQMAEDCGLGVTRFTEYCRRLTNATPMQHLNRLRLEAAARLLVEQPDLSNVRVAEECGFRSPQYFATVFRRHFDCSPQSYRDAHSAMRPDSHGSCVRGKD